MQPYPEVLPPPLDPTPSEQPPTPPIATGYAGTPIGIVVTVGVAILMVNCCVMAAVYYQRDKLKIRDLFAKRFGRGTDGEGGDEEAVSEAHSVASSMKSERRSRRSRSDYEVRVWPLVFFFVEFTFKFLPHA